MGTLLREISLRHLLASPVRTLLVVFGIALGVCMLTAVLATNHSLVLAFEDMVDRVAGKADLTVAGSDAGIPSSLTGDIADLDGVAHAAAMLEVVTRSPGVSGPLLVLGVDFLGDTFFLPFAQEGEKQVVEDPLAFVNDPTAVLVAKKLAKSRGLSVGSPLVLLTGEGEKTFTVKGLLEDEGPAASFGGQVVVMFLDAAQVSFSRGYAVDRIDVVAKDKAQVDALAQRIRALVDGKASVEKPSGRTRRLVRSLWAFKNGLDMSGVVALCVGMFLIYNAVSVSVAMRRREVGVLRALGVTRGQMVRLFCVEALLMAVLGSALGLWLAGGLARLALSMVEGNVSRFILPIHPPSPRITLELALTGFLAGLATTLIAAYLPARSTTRVDPAEALRASRSTAFARPLPVGVASASGLVVALGCIPLAREGGELFGYLASLVLVVGLSLLVPGAVRGLCALFRPLAERLLGMPGRLGLDNVERSLARSAVTVVSLMLAVGMSMTVGAYARSFERSVVQWADDAFPADAVITSGSPLVDRQHVSFAPSVLARLNGVHGIAGTGPVRIVYQDVGGQRAQLAALDTETTFREAKKRGRGRRVLEGPSDIPERALVEGERVIVSENLSTLHGVHAGDRLTMQTPRGPRSFEVYAVVVDYSSDQGWMLMDRTWFVRDFQDEQIDAVDLFLAQGADEAEVIRDVRTALGDTASLFVTSHAALRAQLEAVARNIFAIAKAPELISLIVAIMGVIGTMLAAVLDRVREIGMLRAIGATRGQVVGSLVVEAGFLGLAAVICGIVGGIPQGLVFLKVIGTATSGWNLPYGFPVDTALRMAGFVVSAAALSGFLPGRRAARLDVKEALAYE